MDDQRLAVINHQFFFSKRFTKMATATLNRTAADSRASLRVDRAKFCEIIARRSLGHDYADHALPADREAVVFTAEPHVIESRAVGVSNTGGNTVASQFVGELVRRLDTLTPVLRYATIVTPPYGVKLFDVATVDDVANSGEILTEFTGEAETEVVFGRVRLARYKYSSRPLIFSRELAEDSPDVFVGNLLDLLSRRIYRALNPHLTVGTGAGQPYGILTGAANSGVTTVSNAFATAGELLGLKHSVDAEYWANASFMLHPSTWLTAKKNFDAAGSRFYQPAINGDVDRFDGCRVVLNPSMPTGATSKAVIFGDLSKYFVRMDRDIVLRFLIQRYAELGSIGALCTAEFGGQLTDSNAVKYLTMAA